jgi:LCP family protein required for cell wall assembly
MQVQTHIIPMVRRSGIRHIGRLRASLVILFVGILLLLFACTAFFALYIAFPPPPVDILIMGLDSRGNEGNLTRTDSIMILGINPADMDIGLLSIPRDLFIQVSNYGMQRINTINVLAEMEETGRGPHLLAQSIEQNFAIGIDYYIRLDFQAFVTLVDAVGGLDIDVPDEIVDYQFPTDDYGTREIRFQAGLQHMDGQTALIYARTRHADDDYGRAERQQQVVTALSRKLANPLNWAGAWFTIQQHIDTNMNLFDMMGLIPPMLFNGGDIRRLVIDREYILPGDGYSVPNYAAIQTFISENFD